MPDKRDRDEKSRRGCAHQVFVNLASSVIYDLFLKKFFLGFMGVVSSYIYSLQVFGIPGKYYEFGALQSFALCVAIASPIISNKAFAATPGIGRPAQIGYIMRYWLWISPIFIILALAGIRFSLYFNTTMVFQ